MTRTYAFLCDMTHTYAIQCDMTHTYAFLCDMTHTYAFLCDMTHTYAFLCDMTHTYAFLCDMTHTYACQDFSWLRDKTHSYKRRESQIRVIWITYMCDVVCTCVSFSLSVHICIYINTCRYIYTSPTWETKETKWADMMWLKSGKENLGEL